MLQNHTLKLPPSLAEMGTFWAEKGPVGSPFPSFAKPPSEASEKLHNYSYLIPDSSKILGFLLKAFETHHTFFNEQQRVDAGIRSYSICFYTIS